MFLSFKVEGVVLAFRRDYTENLVVYVKGNDILQVEQVCKVTVITAVAFGNGLWTDTVS